MKTILILGGYGNTGKLVSEFLLKETDCKIIIAGRNCEKAKLLSDKLNTLFSGSRTYYQSLDAGNTEQLIIAFRNVDMVIVCSSTVDYFKNIIDAAIEAGIDYFDINISKEKNEYLISKEDIIKNKNLCYITDGGFHPGVPAALVNYASGKYEKIEKANIFGLLKINWKSYSFSKETITEFVKEFQYYNPLLFKDGNWQKVKSSYSIKADFGIPINKKRMYPMNLDEMKLLPEKFHSLFETGFFVSGFNWFVDYFILPFSFIMFKLFGKNAVNFVGFVFLKGLRWFTKPPYNVIINLKSEGIIKNERKYFEINLKHDDAYLMTAVPVVALVKQYLNNKVKKTGLWYQAHYVEPKQFIRDINLMGIKIDEKYTD